MNNKTLWGTTEQTKSQGTITHVNGSKSSTKLIMYRYVLNESRRKNYYDYYISEACMKSVVRCVVKLDVSYSHLWSILAFYIHIFY